MVEVLFVVAFAQMIRREQVISKLGIPLWCHLFVFARLLHVLRKIVRPHLYDLIPQLCRDLSVVSDQILLTIDLAKLLCK